MRSRTSLTGRSSMGDEKMGADDYLAAGGHAVGDLRQAAVPITAWAAQNPDPRKKPQAERLIDAAIASGVHLFHGPTGDTYASVPVGSHIETLAIRSPGFRSWLLRLFYESEGGAPSREARETASSLLEAMARFDGPEIEVFSRLGEHDGAIYLDLADADWRVVEITPSGWKVLDRAPVRFWRPRGMLPLPAPQPGGSWERLGEFVNLGTSVGQRLFVSWLLGALRPRGPYPILVLHGEQGTGKSTAAKVIRELVDPNMAAIRSEPRDERDLVIAATNGWVVSLDNLSRLPSWLSDAICRLATGAGFGTRTLYSDSDETLFSGARPMVLNSIGEIATRGDLLDRSIILELETIQEGARRTESEFWREFQAARPLLLGALLDAVSAALANAHNIHVDHLPRMADFGKWVAAAEPSLGWETGSFLAAYRENRGAANEMALDASPIAARICELAQARWEGTASALLSDLSNSVDEKVQRLPSWPKDGRGLSNRLRRIAPNLRGAGVEVEFTKPHGKRLITLRLSGDSSVPTVPAFQNRIGGQENGTVSGTNGNADSSRGTQSGTLNGHRNGGNAEFPVLPNPAAQAKALASFGGRLVDDLDAIPF